MSTAPDTISKSSLFAGKRRKLVALAIVVCAFTTGIAWAATHDLFPGPQPDGSAITPQGWRVTPAGEQTALGSGPLAVAVSPKGKFAIVANAGYGNHSLMVVDTATGAVRQTIETHSNALRAEGSSGRDDLAVRYYYPPGAGVQGYYFGLAFSPDGSRAYASDGPGSGIHTFTISHGVLSEGQEIQLHGRVWPAGIAVSPDGGRLLVAGNLSDELIIVNPFARKRTASVHVPVGHLPYAVVLDHSGSLAYVSNWGASTVSVVDTSTAEVIETIDVGLHPSAMALNPENDELYVADTDSDTISVVDSASATLLRTIDMHFAGGPHIGASPNGLAVSPDGSTLYVANAGVNDVAVVKLAPAGSTNADDALAGLIPTAWYPADLAVDRLGHQLLVVNMKGMGVGPIGPGEYVGLRLQGTLSSIPVPGSAELDAFTAQVLANNQVQEDGAPNDGSVIPQKVGDPSPIKYVIYVLKENRTFDQVLGDLGRGNCDPGLVMFPETVTPNQHELARRFVTLDNFYCDAEVSADGWAWSNMAYANTYIQKNWPPDYNIWTRPYDFGWAGDEETAGYTGEPDESFLWDRLAQAGISYRNYGFYMNGLPIEVPESMPNLIGHTDPDYPGWDLKYSEQDRIDTWLADFRECEAAGAMPTVQFVYLPRDHTMVTATGRPAPTAMMADNDLALGRLVEAVSHSTFWGETAIFVVEDDAQDGPDHVDCHRTIAQVISPYTQTGMIDSTFYSTVSMLRTMELIVGVEPLTIFDATATPMSYCFVATPDYDPYTALVPGVDMTATNRASAPGAEMCTTLDFSQPDALPARLVNEVLWKAIRGVESEMPEPIGSFEP
jgi:YVTN family beta-propeller protein